MKLKNNVYYAFKLLASVVSGYSGLEVRNPWNDSEFEPISEYTDENPYYVCAAFRNGRHLPLPIVLEGQSDYPLQNIVLRLLWFTPALRQARKACHAYEERCRVRYLEDALERGSGCWYCKGKDSNLVYSFELEGPVHKCCAYDAIKKNPHDEYAQILIREFSANR